MDGYEVQVPARVDDSFTAEAAALWNAAIGTTFPLRVSLLHACLAATGGRVRAVGVRAAGRLVGFGYASHRTEDVARLQAVVVSPDHRRRGIGRAIARRLLPPLGPRKDTVVEVGAGAGYLWPGVPEDLPEAQVFATALGFVPGLPTYDLRADITRLPDLPGRVAGDGSEGLSFGPADADDNDDILRFVAAEFDPDWAQDLRAFYIAGGRPGDIYVARDPERIVGFARLHLPDSHPIGPPLFWSQRRGPSAGGLGPIGVASARRGQGLGTVLLHASLSHLRSLGSTDIVIDMTHLLAFYGQFGFVPWLRFRQASLQLTGAATR